MKTWEEQVLAPVESALRQFKFEHRIEILEAASARNGGFDLSEYRSDLNLSAILNADLAMDHAAEILKGIEQTGVPVSLALSALAREELDKNGQKTAGAWHSDHRLARSLASRMASSLTPESKVIDPACGAGMLLSALVIEVCGSDRLAATEMMNAGMMAQDLSEFALRGACLSLASLSGDISAIVAMRKTWLSGDSLLDPGPAFIADSFDGVIANPPWEKVKASRHEVLRAMGVERRYGEVSGAGLEDEAYAAARTDARLTSATIAERFPSISGGEVDLYIAFTDLVMNLLKPGGIAGIIVPGGLVRSQGTGSLRNRLFKEMRQANLVIHDNKARHFDIDTRFKFVTATFSKETHGAGRTSSIKLSHATVDADKILINKPVAINMRGLEAVRPDLTLPEVRTCRERDLFQDLTRRGVDWGHQDHPMHPTFCREADMSKERKHFVKASECTSWDDMLPVIEGRMIQAHRFGAKAYQSGEGRAAVWSSILPGRSRIMSQFALHVGRLRPATELRVQATRIGFCDIVGQTNERTFSAAEVPSGVVCGNKVPTIIFQNDPSSERRRLFLAIANSFVFDWMIRRIVTTTVNYFVLTSLRLPEIDPSSLPGRRLVDLSGRLIDMDMMGVTDVDHLRRIAKIRAEIDALIAAIWGGADAIDLILDDFALLDRGQPTINGEPRSTITRDLIVSCLPEKFVSKEKAQRATQRIGLAESAGAIAYLTDEATRNMKRSGWNTKLSA